MKHGKKKALIISLTAAASLAALLAAYVVQAEQYDAKYISGTVINGVDVSNMTTEEARAAIAEKTKDHALSITFEDGTTETIPGSAISLETTSADADVSSILEAQDKMAWIAGHLGNKKNYTVSENTVYDEASLRAAVEALPELDASRMTAPVNAHMEMGDDGALSVVPEVKGNEINEDKLLEKIENALKEGKTAVTLTDDEYVLPTVMSDDAALTAQVEDLNGFLATSITYQLHTGETMVLDKGILKTWLSTSADDSTYYYINTDVLKVKTKEYAAEIAARDNETKTTKTFHSTARGDMEVTCSPYGYIVDETKEADQLYQDLLNRGTITRQPVYKEATSSDGFGSTYIEVDLTNQHLWYYVDGALYYECDFVSGLAGDPDRETPKGAYSIYMKQRDRDLKGPIGEDGEPSYVSHVDFWMPFNRNVGLHNAPWRSSFGGDIYQYSGSHGCINLSYTSAETIYNKVTVGTPVIVI